MDSVRGAPERSGKTGFHAEDPLLMPFRVSMFRFFGCKDLQRVEEVTDPRSVTRMRKRVDNLPWMLSERKRFQMSSDYGRLANGHNKFSI